MTRADMKRRQRGFTISELMITVALSLSVISSVLIGYLATYTSSMDTLAASKLNQDMGALMSLMVSELRRAGYSGTVPTTPDANLFSQVGGTGTALAVFNSMALNAQQTATGSGSCVTFSYDYNEDGDVDEDEVMGFRLSTTGGIVEMRNDGDPAAANDCSGEWPDLTDPDFINVTALTFNLANSSCLNTREPNLVDDDMDTMIDNAEEADCYENVPTGGSGDITVETREITITMEATLTNDTFVRLKQSQNVRVRNDLVRVY